MRICPLTHCTRFPHAAPQPKPRNEPQCAPPAAQTAQRTSGGPSAAQAPQRKSHSEPRRAPLRCKSHGEPQCLPCTAKSRSGPGAAPPAARIQRRHSSPGHHAPLGPPEPSLNKGPFCHASSFPRQKPPFFRGASGKRRRYSEQIGPTPRSSEKPAFLSPTCSEERLFLAQDSSAETKRGLIPRDTGATFGSQPSLSRTTGNRATAPQRKSLRAPACSTVIAIGISANVTGG